MGAVYPCRDEILDRPVAVKIVREGSEQRRMVDEVQALLKLRSKHVVQAYDLLKFQDGTIAVVQEFIEGSDLFDEATHAGSTEQLYKQLWQIATGIRDIHLANLIHRDIKPNNMKVDREGVIKIFDFGLARNEGPDASTLGFVGTRGFAAPELYMNRAVFTPSIDVYAFGASAVYLANRNLPSELMEVPPLPPTPSFIERLNGGIAPDIKASIAQCLSPAAGERPTMESVRHLLSRYLLVNRHQALLVSQGQPSYLHAGNRTVSANLPGIGGISINYNSLDFIVRSIEGEVYINNMPARVNQALPGSCVIALGSPRLANSRRYITFDLSSPEVVL
ncbi:serine/threonine protein kinase [Xanthomonas dyei]|nr:serine/threonine-protein kinase [Xanthomonas dyei]